MNRDIAAEVHKLTEEAMAILNESVGTIQQLCSARAASVYSTTVGRAMGEMATEVFFPIWRVHPDLEPAAMQEPSGYNPRDYDMSLAAIEKALGAVAAARALMEQAQARAQSEPDANVRQAYVNGVTNVLDAVDAVANGVRRRKV
jgi:hypothetical protein